MAKKSVFLMCKVTPEFRSIVNEYAAKNGMSTSAVIRNLLIKAMEGEKTNDGV